LLFKKIGQKVSRFGDVLQQPSLLSLRLRGIEVRTFESLNKPWLINSGIKTVFDIGANTGQFARAIHEILPEAFIYSFEPLPDCFRELQNNMRKVKNFQAFNIALADSSGQEVFYRSAWSPSSSLRPMGSVHKENFPYTAGESREIVQIRRLDDYLEELNIQDHILVKMDVQGCEDKVIDGARCLLKRARFLIIETSMVPLYDGQPLFRDIFASIDNLGFRYEGSLSQLTSPLDGAVLQADVIFKQEI